LVPLLIPIQEHLRNKYRLRYWAPVKGKSPSGSDRHRWLGRRYTYCPRSGT